MKIFDIQKRDLTYCFKVWDHELPRLKDLARVFGWKLLSEPLRTWDVFREVQISVGDKSEFGALIEQLLDIPDIEFEGGKPPSRPSPKSSPRDHALKRKLAAKSKASKGLVRRGSRKA